jgi:hypothetical protein
MIYGKDDKTKLSYIYEGKVNLDKYHIEWWQTL